MFRTATFCLVAIVACGGSALPTGGTAKVEQVNAVEIPPPPDRFVDLRDFARDERVSPTSWAMVGNAEVAGGILLPQDERDFDVFAPVILIEENEQQQRVFAVANQARIALWIDKAAIVVGLQHRTAIDVPFASIGDEPAGSVSLNTGTGVVVVATSKSTARVRYYGQTLAVEGDVPKSAFSSTPPNFDRMWSHPISPPTRSTVLVVPGGVIRKQPSSIAPALATTRSYLRVNVVRDVDPAWREITYQDSHVSLTGYYAGEMPRGDPRRPVVKANTVPIQAGSVDVPKFTCLFSEDRSLIGFTTADLKAQPVATAADDSVTLEVPTQWGNVRALLIPEQLGSSARWQYCGAAKP